MSAILDIAGIASSFLGIVMMTRYSLPFHLPPLPNGFHKLSEAGHVEDDRRNFAGLGGLLLFGVGTILQVFAVLMR
jgi:hypothetical protein